MARKKDREYKDSMERALENPRLKSQYLKEVERLFKGKKGTDEHDRMLQRLHDSYGSGRFKKTALEYVKEYGLPDDWGSLLLLLDLEGEQELVCDAMEKLVEMSAQRSSVERRGLRSKLSVISATSKDMVVAETAEALLMELD
jgi:hypothetical protein